METASTLILDILQEVQVQASEQAIQAVDSNTVIRYMNRYMASIDAQGVNLGYTKITNQTDYVTVPDGALEGIVFNVALRILNSYDIPLTPELQQSARDSYKSMLKISNRIIPARPPCTLPIGSGNEGDSDYRNNHFYPCEEDTIATEQYGNIALEQGTNDQ